jgi:hypothetical protein
MVGAVRSEGRVSEDPVESGFDISGFLRTKELPLQESRYRETRYPDKSELWAPEGVIEDKCHRASGFGVLEVLCTLHLKP